MITLDAWIGLAAVLSNSHPHFTASDRRAIQLSHAAVASDQLGNGIIGLLRIVAAGHSSRCGSNRHQLAGGPAP